MISRDPYVLDPGFLELVPLSFKRQDVLLVHPPGNRYVTQLRGGITDSARRKFAANVIMLWSYFTNRNKVTPLSKDLFTVSTYIPYRNFA